MLALAAVWTAAGAGRRLVAIADLHGDLHAGVRVLKLAGLVDDRQHWAGGDAVLVQTGDIVDRGGEAKQLYELFQRLAAEAAGRGGAVHNLLGNHDIMNMLGDVRYVNKSDYAHFGGAKARARAFSAAGELGQWLRSLPVALRLGDTVFVHAGITPEWAALGIDGINARTRAALGPSAGMSSRSSILGSNGPVRARRGVARRRASVRGGARWRAATRGGARRPAAPRSVGVRAPARRNVATRMPTARPYATPHRPRRCGIAGTTKTARRARARRCGRRCTCSAARGWWSATRFRTIVCACAAPASSISSTLRCRLRSMASTLSRGSALAVSNLAAMARGRASARRVAPSCRAPSRGATCASELSTTTAWCRC